MIKQQKTKHEPHQRNRLTKTTDYPTLCVSTHSVHLAYFKIDFNMILVPFALLIASEFAATMQRCGGEPWLRLSTNWRR